ncbi:UPF0663 family protein [Dictyostelium discoideum AX4]|uniref:Protein HID1 n=1 Tax=Dictyostelium discoideum TaxID=44689 RepID=HID1_DICDI|nr:UPF0663 family protein [Dictyostelium discoideum AX4]Q54JJ6.1 RecName: Full=Protein HID1; AltName: Full=HID1 domain-containing protein; AltName: Full=Protein hid-1 homolog [Dictyostelium discoideum]EAL63430.1 UPF0663 family protein [Dictyostelium discoideum AX4]|eukprot:XP_636935.1 UPF0663 family protein [Dictyostelium discoideum AX4]
MGTGSSREQHLNSFNTLQKETVPFSSDLWKTILSQNLEDDSLYLENLKKLKNERPENLATFIKKLVNQLVLVKGLQRETNTPGDFQLTSISLSYLSRILPIVFESGDDFADKVFWLNEGIEPLSHPSAKISTPPSITTTKTTEIIEEQEKKDQENKQVEENKENEEKKDEEKKDEEKKDEEKKDEDKKENKTTTTTTTTNTTNNTNNNNNSDESSFDTTPLAVKLMDSLLDLLFFPGFTVTESLGLKSPKEASPDAIPVLFSWAGGFGVDSVPTVHNKQFWINRLSVLQCLITCLSEQLYVPQDSVSTFKSKWLDWITHTQEYYTEALLFSLINTFATFDPIGWGIPYNHLMYSDDHEICSKLSIQILNVLLTYDPIENNDQQPQQQHHHHQQQHHQQQQQQQQSTIECRNKFIQYIKTLKRVRDFKFFFNAFERIMNVPLIASHTKLPNSTKKIELHQDLTYTMWLFLSYNHDFLRSIVNYENSPEFLIPLLQYMDEGRKSQTTHGIVQIGTFILLLLSGERDFSISLNKPFVGRIHIDIQQPQVYSDFVITVMYRLLVDTPDRLESIYECVLTILSNLSPYMKNLSMVTCVKLMKLFEYLSTPRFLFATNHNYRYVGFLLESLNNLLQHQYESNTRLIYAILRCQNQFSKLAYLKISPVTPSKPMEQITQPSPISTSEEAFGKLNKLSISEEPSTLSNEKSDKTTDGGDHQDESISKSKVQSKPTTEHPNSTGATPSSTNSGTPTIKAFSSTTPNQESPKLGGDGIDSQSSTPNKQQLPPPPPQQTKKTQMVSHFMPTDEWLQDIKKQLPLDNILKVITHLSPQIQGLCTGSGSDEQKIMDYLKMSTIVGIFHNPGPIMTRRYHSNAITKSWFIAYMWCIIYLENHSPPLFLHTNIKLFQVKQ